MNTMRPLTSKENIDYERHTTTHKHANIHKHIHTLSCVYWPADRLT